MNVILLVGLVLLMAGCIATPQYRDPLASLTKDGPFARRELRVGLADNTRQSLKHLAEYGKVAAGFGNAQAVSDFDPNNLLDGLHEVLMRRFKRVVIDPNSAVTSETPNELRMILDARVDIGVFAGQSTEVELSGIFIGNDQETVDTVKGTGRVVLSLFETRRGYRPALTAALADFARNLDGAAKLTAYATGPPAGTALIRPSPAPPAISRDTLKTRVRDLGGASWALVVGIDAYRHADRLNYAVADAQAVAAALPALGFQQVRTLLDADATKTNIERVIYGEFKERMGPRDRLFVFFAGHGITVKLPRGGEEGYLIPVDADPRQPELTAIPMDEIRKMGKRVSAKHIFFAIDSCFSGFALTRDITPEAVNDAEIASALEEPVVQVLTAGRRGQKAIEEEGHGLFTRRLLDGLRGRADREGRGFVTVTQLAAWVGPRVARDSGGRQHPQYSALDGEGDFVFVLPGDPQRSR
jgi:hypothetical protein